jgi:hypothetical protein
MLSTACRFAARSHLGAGFTALEHMNDKGRRALIVAGLMWEKLLREAVERAEKAEWLLARAENQAADWGVAINSPEAARHWEIRHRPRPDLVPWYEARMEKRREEMRELPRAWSRPARASGWPRPGRGGSEAAPIRLKLNATH